jgi:hypothetical protein
MFPKSFCSVCSGFHSGLAGKKSLVSAVQRFSADRPRQLSGNWSRGMKPHENAKQQKNPHYRIPDRAYSIGRLINIPKPVLKKSNHRSGFNLQ